eukprot:UN03513
MSENDKFLDRIHATDLKLENADHKACTYFAAQVLLNRHPSLMDDDYNKDSNPEYNEKFDLPQEWPEMELHHSETIYKEVVDLDPIRNAFLHLTEVFELDTNQQWNKKMFSELCSKISYELFSKT